MTRLNVLFICTANVQRSPTAEQVARDHFAHFFNPRSRGIAGHREMGGRECQQDDINWAHEIVTMEPWHESALQNKFKFLPLLRCLEIADRFNRGEPVLCDLLHRSCHARVTTGKWLSHGMTVRTMYDTE